MVSLMTVYGNPQYYVESVEELNNIPENAPPSTIAIVNTEDGVYKYMKSSSGSWNNAGTYSGGDYPTAPLYPRG